MSVVFPFNIILLHAIHVRPVRAQRLLTGNAIAANHLHTSSVVKSLTFNNLLPSLLAHVIVHIPSSFTKNRNKV